MTSTTVELIVFNIGHLNLALPIKAVYKVSNYTSISGSKVGFIGVTQVEGREVTVIDLYQRFFKSQQTCLARDAGRVEIDEQSEGALVISRKSARSIRRGVPVIADRFSAQSPAA